MLDQVGIAHQHHRLAVGQEDDARHRKVYLDVEILIVVQLKDGHPVARGRAAAQAQAVELGPFHVEGRPQIVEQRIEDQALLDRHHLVGVGSEKTQPALGRQAELDVVAVAPRFGRADDVLDTSTSCRPPMRANWSITTSRLNSAWAS